jgi:hypothetical protein
MSWGSNYRRPANGIMWTLFFAGSAFARHTKVDGVNIKTSLQQHYLDSMRVVAERIADLPKVMGVDTLNEPGSGYIGAPIEAPLSKLFGEAWTPLDGLAVASGFAREVELLALGGRSTGKRRTFNDAGVPIWLPGYDDPFRARGAWDIDGAGRAVACLPDFFSSRTVHQSSWSATSWFHSSTALRARFAAFAMIG